jgi:hypothetical protein
MATVTVLEPNTRFEDRLTQVDARLTRTFRFERVRLQGMFDVYTLLNSSSILNRVNTYGPTWGRPTQILAARLVEFGVQLDF